MATLIHGKVLNGRIEIEELPDYVLPEGTDVSIVVRDDDDENGFELSEEEAAELDRRTEAVERGEWIDGDEVLARLRSRSGRSVVLSTDAAREVEEPIGEVSRTIHTRVRNKSIIVEDETLPEGAEVTIHVGDQDGFDIDDPELERELLLGIAEADAGDVIPLEEFLHELRTRTK